MLSLEHHTWKGRVVPIYGGGDGGDISGKCATLLKRLTVMLKHTMLFVLKFEHTPKPARETFGCTRADAVLAKQELSHTTIYYCSTIVLCSQQPYGEVSWTKSMKAIRELSDAACKQSHQSGGQRS